MNNTTVGLTIEEEFTYLLACRRNEKNITISKFSDDVTLDDLREQLRFFLLGVGWSDEQLIKLLGKRP